MYIIPTFIEEGDRYIKIDVYAPFFKSNLGKRKRNDDDDNDEIINDSRENDDDDKSY